MENLAVVNELISKLDRLKIPRAVASTRTNPIIIGSTTLSFLSPDPVRIFAAWADQVLTDIRDEYTKPVESYLARLLLGSEPTEPPGAYISQILRAGRISNWATIANDSSLVMELGYQNAPYALFTADAGKDVLREVTSGKQYQYLKVSHHGSSSGLDDALVNQWRPTWAFIPVGDNPHGHPDLEVLKMLKKYGVTTFCSERTRFCRRSCPEAGFGSVRHIQAKLPLPGVGYLDPGLCRNNDPLLRD